MMNRVDFRYWKEGSGYSHSETIDHIPEGIGAEEYINRLIENDNVVDPGCFDAINVELYDEDDNLVSEYFWERED